MTQQSISWPAERPFSDLLNESQPNQLTDLLTDSFTNWLNDSLTNWLSNSLTDLVTQTD